MPTRDKSSSSKQKSLDLGLSEKPKRINRSKLSEQQKEAAEMQIKEKQKEVKYDIRDFTIDYIVKEFRDGFFYIPPYQREFVWNPEKQSRFIESVILGLPIPMMFVADMDDGRLEIVDGAQRIQTLEQFMNGDIKLSKLDRLPAINKFRFHDLPISQQRKIGTKALRVVVLEDTTTADLRQEIFNRVNTSGERARASEVRRGAYVGPFMDFVSEMASNHLFSKLCPISEVAKSRREGEELVLRFFAYSDHYQDFQHDVDKFLDAYARQHQHVFDKERMREEFESMLKFTQRYLQHGFTKSESINTTPRVRFEALAVGINLALRIDPDVTPVSMTWLDSPEFIKHTTTHASNSGPRLRGRIEFVRDSLLGRAA